MHEESLTPASISFYALLHDVGKPVVRLAHRYLEGIEKKDDGVIRQLKIVCCRKKVETDLLERITREGHENVSNAIINELVGEAPPPQARELIREIIKGADISSAYERGFEESYEKVRKYLDKIEERINKKLGPKDTHHKYTHYTAPLLSPFWIIDEADYLKGVGENALCGRRWDPETGVAKVRATFKEIINVAREARIDEVGDKVGELLKRLSKKKIWLPVNAVTPMHLIGDDFRAMTLDEAMKRNNYSAPVGIMLKLLARLRYWYNIQSARNIPRGLTDTVHQILRATALLIPSAIYGAVVPDISLYSHSKLVAAYAASIKAGGGKVALMGLDANNIQGFIYSSTQAAAASRLMRGRSFLVEIALESLARYALEVLGKLPETNVMVSEGGLLTLVAPCGERNKEEMKKKLGAIQRVGDELASEIGGGIGFTVGISECFSPSIISFFGEHENGRTNYADIVKSLMIDLAARKLRKIPEHKCKNSCIEQKIPLGYDTLTKEPILSEEDLITVTEELRDYFQEIAGGKLEVGDTISNSTHLSLVAGTSLRNSIALISIYLYKRLGGPKNIEPEPSPEEADKIVTKIKEAITKEYLSNEHGTPSERRIRLHYVIGTGAVKHGVGIIPLRSVGAVHVIISRITSKPIDTISGSIGNDPALWTIVRTVIEAVTNVTKKEYGCQGTEALVRISLINDSTDFVPDPSSKPIEKIIETSRSGCIDIGFGYRWLNTYHPVETQVEGEAEKLSLISLDRYGVIALAKLDLDMFGDVMGVISSISPSRSSTASDLTGTVTAGTAYTIAINEAIGQSVKGRNFDAIPLYGGGDDITIYGSVGATSYLLLRIARKVSEVLRPITGTASLIIEDSHAPILSVYTSAIERLEEGKRVRSVVAFAGDEPREVSLNCEKTEILSFLPLTLFDSWRNTDVKWPFDSLLNVFSPAKVEENMKQLEEYLNLLQKISYLGYLAQKYLEKRSYEERAQIAVAYAYLWARNRDLMIKLNKELNDKLGTINEMLDKKNTFSDPRNVNESINTLAASKPIMDLLILAIRRKETALPSIQRTGPR